MDKEGAAFEYIEGVVWVATALVAEAGIGRELVTASGLTNAHWVEVCALEEDIGCCLRDTRFLSAEHTSDTHGLLGIADHEVSCRQGTLYAVEGNEFLSFGSVLNDDFVAFDLICIEGVECLSHFVENEVGHVHHVVDRANADGVEGFLEPVW